MIYVPRHVAIIMDGNGRWAKRRGFPRRFGHKRGADRVKEIIKEAKSLGVKVLTLFTFSTENWNRSTSEVKFLFAFLERFIKENETLLVKENVKLVIVGRKDRFNKGLLQTITEVQNLTQDNASLTLNVALDYGGRWDIIQASQRLARDVAHGKLAIAAVSERVFGSYLSLVECGDPDLLIRTSGELRISNFLLWQLAYSEFYFTDVLWPDFNKACFRKAIEEYSRRKRRFGAVRTKAQ